VQSDILRLLAKNRSDSSYLAGGLMLNKDWERRSDDIDIFHDTTKEVTRAQSRSVVLDAAGFKTPSGLHHLWLWSMRPSRATRTTIIQMVFAETRLRFFPLVKTTTGSTASIRRNLAINKVLAAAGRSKGARYADLVAIGRDIGPLGPLVLAAAGKPPNFSPRRTIDEIRRHALSIPAEEFAAVRGMPSEWSAALHSR